MLYEEMGDTHLEGLGGPNSPLLTQTDPNPASESAVARSISSPESRPEPDQGHKDSKRGIAFFAPLRIANFRRLIAGQTISRLGDQFYFIAIPWLILRTTSDPLILALVLGSSSLTLGVFTLVGGVLADRYGPRTLMLGSDSARFAIIGILAGLAIFSTPPLWVIGLLAALLGMAGGLFYPASGAMTPHLVPTEDLQAANSFEQLTFQSSNFVGPGIAGVILSATRLTFGFVVDAVSFLASVISLVFIHMPPRPRSPSESPTSDSATKNQKQSGIAAFADALRFLRSTPFLLMLFGLSFLGNFAVGGLFEVATPLLFKERVGLVAGPEAFGLATAGFGLGSIVGAVAAGVAAKIHHKAVISLIAILPTVAFIILVPFIPGTFAAAALFAGVGVFLGISNVLLITVVQTLIPLHMMGRMMSLTMLGSLVGSPVSIFVYGIAATLMPIPWLFVIGASLLGFGVILGLLNKITWQSI
jgi:predicted MFS family arabinose efflux permease